MTYFSKNLIYFLFSLLIFLCPFIINPFFGAFFEPPKVIFAEILIELILVILLLRGRLLLKELNEQVLPFGNKYQLVLSLILFFITLIHLFTTKNTQIFFGNEVRLQGILLFWHLLVLFILSSKLNIGKLPKALFPISLLFLLLTTFLVEPDVNGRAIGTLGEANALASSAVFFWPFAVFIKIYGKWKNILLKAGILFTTLVVILFTGSRSGMLALLVQIIFLILARWISLKKATITVTILLLATLILPPLRGGGWYENRGEIWKTAIVAGQQKYWGWGFGNIEQALYQTSLNLNNNLKYQAVDSSHNFLLDFWVQGGILGLGSILLLIFISLKSLVKNNKVIEIITLMGLICVLFFNPASVATLVAFWFILGQGFNSYGKLT